MDAFSYLSVLISIIIGLAITQILQGYRGLLLARARVRLDMPALVWSGLILLIATQMWWSSFGLAQVRRWTFLGFGTVLLQATTLYMLAGLILPDMPADRPLDLAEHYRRERRPFFALMIALLLLSALKEVVFDGRFPHGGNLDFHLAFLALSAVAFVSRSDRLHRWLTPVAALAILSYVLLLFATLRSD